MKKRTTWILIAVAINLLLLPFTLQRPPAASAQATRAAWMFDCCRDWSDGRRLCCFRCCWWPRMCPPEGCEKPNDG